MNFKKVEKCVQAEVDLTLCCKRLSLDRSTLYAHVLFFWEVLFLQKTAELVLGIQIHISCIWIILRHIRHFYRIRPMICFISMLALKSTVIRMSVLCLRHLEDTGRIRWQLRQRTRIHLDWRNPDGLYARRCL